MKTEKFRIGLIDFDNSLQYYYAEDFFRNPYSTLVAVAGKKVPALNIAEKYNAEWYFDYKDLLKRKDIDIVSICSRNVRHAKQVFESLDSGKNVICENPLALDLDTCKKIGGKLKKEKLKLLIPFKPRFNAAFAQMRGLVKQGDIGDLRNVYLSAIVPRAYRKKDQWFLNRAKSGGGCILDLGSHAIDYLRWLIDSKPTKLFAVGKGNNQGETETTGLITIRFANGTIATVLVSWLGGQFKTFEGDRIRGEMTLELVGHDRTVVMDAYHQKLNTCGIEQDTIRQIYWGGFETAEIVQNFINSLISDQEVHPNHEDAAETLRLVLAAYRSSQTRTQIDL